MIKKTPIIGVLALQGCVARHKPHIEAAGGEYRAVKTIQDFEAIDAFILPGGESTTMLTLIENFGLWEALAQHFTEKPVWGICAGSILLAQTVTNPVQKSFSIVPVTVQRNGYGTQRESHMIKINDYQVSLIRAPIITKIADDIEVKSTHQGHPVWVQCGNKMLTTFHPELTFDFPSPMHHAFMEIIHQSLGHDV